MCMSLQGFSVIFGLIVAALLQYFVEGVPMSPNVLVALPLVIVSTLVHTQNPYKPSKHHKE